MTGTYNLQEHSAVASQVIDLATSLAKVADVDRNLGNENVAVEGFEEAIKCLEKLKLDSEQASLEQREAKIYPCVTSSRLCAPVCSSGLTFGLYFCSAAQSLTFYTNNWMISQADGNVVTVL